MRELGVWDDCHYLGFSSDPLHAFVGLAHDLKFAEDFLHGSAEVLRRAAVKEAGTIAQQADSEMASAVGDTDRLSTLHTAFYAREYDRVIATASELKFPERLSNMQRSMIQIARKKAGSELEKVDSAPTRTGEQK